MSHKAMPYPQQVTWWGRQSVRARCVLLGAACAVVALLAVAGAVSRNVAGPADKAPAATKTPTEAACSMLRDGDNPQQAYDAMRSLLADQSYAVGDDTAAAARLAVARAVAQGC